MLFAQPVQAQIDREAQVRAVIDALVANWNAGDADEFADLFTDEGIIAFVTGGEPSEVTADEARAELAEFFGDPPVALREVIGLTVSGNTAYAVVVTLGGGSLSADRLEFTRVAGEWLVSGWTFNVRRVPPPTGYESVPVDMFDYGFRFDIRAIAPGDSFAFLARNVGNEPHELVFFKVPAGLNLQAALRSEEEPPVEFLGATFAEAGETASTMLIDSIAAGRYAMICFIETPQGTPHWELGMLAEFTLPAAQATPTATPTRTATVAPTATAAAVRTVTPAPPRTGSGGLLDEDEGLNGGLLAALGLTIVIAAYGTYELRRRRSD